MDLLGADSGRIMRGSVYKRCQCPVERNTKGERLACKKAHGSWSFIADAPAAAGKRRQIKCGGFSTKKAAEKALAELVDSASKGTLADDQQLTVKAYLTSWIADKQRLGMRPTTARSYKQHIDSYIDPAIGSMRLKDVRPIHIDQVLAGVKASPATVRRVHATVRSAFATAKRRRLISFNPAIDVELPSASRPKVKPWEPVELGKFLDSIAPDDFGALFETVAATGCRRGEVAGMRWADLDLEDRTWTVRQQLVALYGDQATLCPHCGRPHKGATFGPTKTKSGDARAIELDSGVVGVLLAHRLHQDAEKATWGDAYVDHGLVFAQPDGNPIPTQQLTQRFTELTAAAGLRRVRLHDLRHGQASLMLAAGVPIAVVSKRLGHSTITITSDTYSHLLAGVGRDAAERANALVPRASRDQSVTNLVADEPISETESVTGPGNTGAEATGPLAQSVELRTFNP